MLAVALLLETILLHTIILRWATVKKLARLCAWTYQVVLELSLTAMAVVKCGHVLMALVLLRPCLATTACVMERRLWDPQLRLLAFQVSHMQMAVWIVLAEVPLPQTTPLHTTRWRFAFQTWMLAKLCVSKDQAVSALSSTAGVAAKFGHDPKASGPPLVYLAIAASATFPQVRSARVEASCAAQAKLQVRTDSSLLLLSWAMSSSRAVLLRPRCRQKLRKAFAEFECGPSQQLQVGSLPAGFGNPWAVFGLFCCTQYPLHVISQDGSRAR